MSVRENDILFFHAAILCKINEQAIYSRNQSGISSIKMLIIEEQSKLSPKKSNNQLKYLNQIYK